MNGIHPLPRDASNGYEAVASEFAAARSAEIGVATVRAWARDLEPGGRLLFTSPREPCTWADTLTGLASTSLGHDRYEAILSEAGMALIGEYRDEGNSHYYSSREIVRAFDAS